MKIINKWTIIIVVILIIGGGIFLFIHNKKPTTSQYLTATAVEGSVIQTVTSTGSVVAGTEQNANFATSGIISEVDVSVGQTVTNGQLLAKLNPTADQNIVAQDQANLNEANNNLTNAYTQNQPNQYDINSMQQQINTAQDKVNTDQANLADYELNSPQAGTVQSITGSVGSTSGPSTGTSSQPFVILTPTGGSTPVDVYFAIQGTISEIDVSVGQTVSAGQILGKLNDTTAVSQLDMDQASLAEAQDSLNSKLADAAPTATAIANLKDAITTAQEKLSTDEQTLAENSLNSTVSGIVTTINDAVGDTVSGSGSSAASASSSSTSSTNDVMTIIDPTSLVVDLEIDETDIAKISIGQAVQLSFQALGTKTYVGIVKSIDMTATTTSGVVYYEVTVSINKLDNSIKDGMTANATIITQTVNNVIAIPNSAIQSVNGQETVQIMKNGSPTTVNVTTGISDDTNTDVTTGVNVGDIVVTGTVPTTTSTATSATGGTTNSSGFGGGGGGLGSGGTAVRFSGL